MGAFAAMTANQGISIILNIFYGVTLNATMGITNQVSNAVNQFVVNIQTAFNPQIIISYVQNKTKEFIDLILNCGRISIFLMLIIVIPLEFYMDIILHIWLVETPPYLSIFCRITLAYIVIDTLSTPLRIGVNATGNNRNYQILVSSVLLLILPISYFLLKKGCPPYIVIFVRLIDCTISLFLRIYIFNKITGTSITFKYFSIIIRMSIAVLITVIPLFFLWNRIDPTNINQSIFFISITFIWEIITLILIGIPQNGRKKLYKLIIQYLHGKN